MYDVEGREGNSARDSVWAGRDVFERAERNVRTPGYIRVEVSYVAGRECWRMG